MWARLTRSSSSRLGFVPARHSSTSPAGSTDSRLVPRLDPAHARPRTRAARRRHEPAGFLISRRDHLEVSDRPSLAPRASQDMIPSKRIDRTTRPRLGHPRLSCAAASRASHLSLLPTLALSPLSQPRVVHSWHCLGRRLSRDATSHQGSARSTTHIQPEPSTSSLLVPVTAPRLAPPCSLPPSRSRSARICVARRRSRGRRGEAQGAPFAGAGASFGGRLYSDLRLAPLSSRGCGVKADADIPSPSPFVARRRARGYAKPARTRPTRAR